MRIKTSYIESSTTEKKRRLPILLSNEEVFLIRLEALNLDDKEKAVIIERDLHQITVLRRRIQKKFCVNEWPIIIKKSFQLGILVPSDYVYDFIKRGTTQMVDRFYEVIWNNNLTKNGVEENLLPQLENYAVWCREKLLKSNEDITNTLSDKDILCFNNLKKIYISEENSVMDFNSILIDEYYLKIKLGASNRFSLLRSAYANGFINEEKFEASKKQVILSYTWRLSELKLLNHTPVDHKMLIWSLLIEFSFDLEFSYIFS